MSLLKELSVSELGGYIKSIFDAEEMLQNVKVFGELSGCQIVRGVAYFSLKDENALLSCVMFGVDNKNFGFKDGDQVCVTGSPKFYIKGGKLNFNVNKIEAHGQGELFKKFLELKESLEKKGFFSSEHKKPIPSSIKRIGVVTSFGGAVLQDIINIRSRRDNSVDIVVYPAKVQGVGAEKEIVAGIQFFSEYPNVDVVVVARGGGSLEDLQPFNSLEVAQAVFDCKKPIVSAVGHETDFSICDFVADLRVPTPSAAAEVLTQDKAVLKTNLIKLTKRFVFSSQTMLNSKRATLNLQKTKIINVIQKIFDKNSGAVDKMATKVVNLSRNFVNEKLYNTNLLNNSLNKLNPKTILSLGYAKLEKDGLALTSTKDLIKGDEFVVNLSDGQIFSEVKEIKGEY